MKKRILSLLLVVIMLCGMLPTTVMAAGTSLTIDNDATYTTVDINDQAVGSGTVQTLTLYLQSTYGKVYVDSATQDGMTIDIVLAESTDPSAALQAGLSGTGLTYPMSHSGNTCTLSEGSGTMTYAYTASGGTVTYTINFTTAGGTSGGTEAADPIGITMTFVDGGQIVEVEGEKIYNAEVTVVDTNEDGKLTIGEAFTAFHEQWYGNADGYAETSTETLIGWVTKFWGKSATGLSYARNHGWAHSTQDEITDGDQLTAYFSQADDYLDLLTWFDEETYTAEAGTSKEFSVNGVSIYKSGESSNVLAVPNGATVTVYDSTGSAVNGLATTTDENGKFSVTFPEAGSYSIIVGGTCSYTANGVTTSDAPVVPAYCEVTVEAAEEPAEEINLSASCANYDISFAVSGATVKSATTTVTTDPNGTLDLVVTDVTGSVVVTPTMDATRNNLPFLAFDPSSLSLDVSSGSNSSSITAMIFAGSPRPYATWTVNVTVASDSGNGDEEEEPATLDITTDLSEDEVKYTVGGTATALTVVAEQSEGKTVSYQWYSNSSNSTEGGTAIDGATSASYTPSTEAAGTTYYYVVATCGDLTANSKIAMVTVAPATLDITTDLSEDEVKYTVGGTASALAVTAVQSAGKTVSYQWYSNSSNSTEGGTAIDGATSANYTPSTEVAGTTYYYVVATCGELTATSKIAMVTVEAEEEEGESWNAATGTLKLDATTDNGSMYSVTFTDESGNVIDGLTATLDGTTINVNVPRSHGADSQVKATFDLTQNDSGLPFITTKTGVVGTSSGKAVTNKFTEKTITLSGGQATFTFYFYNVVPTLRNNPYTTYTIKFSMENTAPALAGVAARSDTITANEAYNLDLSTVFTDADGDDLTYKVSVDGATAVAADAAYSYTTLDPGEHTLSFTAYDSYSGVSEAFVLTLTVSNKTETYDVTVTVPEGIEPTFYYTADAAEGTELTADAEGNVYTVKVPTNISTISWRYDSMGMSTAVSTENNSLTLYKTDYVVMAGDNVDANAVVTVKYGNETAVGNNNSFLMLSTGTYAVSVAVSADYTAGWKDVSLTGQNAEDGDVFIELESKEITFTVPYYADLYVCAANTIQGTPTTEIQPTKVGTTDYATQSRTDSYDLKNGTVYEYRVSVTTAGNAYVPGSDECVTFVGMFKKTDSTTSFTVTKDQILDGSNGRKTIDHELESYTNGTLASANVADLYMNVNAQGYLKMTSGQTKNLYTARTWWATNCGGWAMNTYYYLEPDYTYTVVDLNGQPSSGVITIDEKGKITAVGDGTAIVLVTYDAMNVDIDDQLYQESGPEKPLNDGFFSAIWPENTGVFVVSVGAGESGITTGMTINTSTSVGSKTAGYNLDAEHDVIYYLGDKGEYTFTPGTEDVTVSVANPSISNNVLSFSGFTTLSANADGSVTVPLTYGRNIVKVEKNGAAEYQVITAKKVTATVNGVPLEEAVVAPGEEVSIVFDTLYNPVNRLGMYNTGAAVVYREVSGWEGKTAGNYSGGMGFYFFASHDLHQKVANFNSVGSDGSAYANAAVNLGATLTVPEDFEEPYFTLTDGAFHVSGFSKFQFGDHREVMGTPPTSGSSNNLWAYFGHMPDISIRTTNCVESASLSGIAVTEQPTKTTYSVGDAFETDGMVVTATYSDGSTKAVTGYTCAPETFTAAGAQTVTISYTEGDVTKTTTVTVMVEAAQEEDATISMTTDLSEDEVKYTVGGNAAALTVEAKQSKGDTVSYQWYSNSTKSTENSTVINGATSASYIPSTDAAGTTYYYAVATCGNLTATSRVAMITVEAKQEESEIVLEASNSDYSISFVVEGATVLSAKPVISGYSGTLTLVVKDVTAADSEIKITPTVSGYEIDTDVYYVLVNVSSGSGNNHLDIYQTVGGYPVTKLGTWTINVTVETAPVTLTGISVTTQPTKTTYTVGDAFEAAGMVITAAYSDGSTKTVTGYTCTPETFTAAGAQTVTVSYTEGDVTKTATVDVTVEEAEVPVTLTSIAVTKQPTKTLYNIGERFDPTGMVITAAYSDGSSKTITGYTYTTSALTKNTSVVTIGYTEGGITRTATVSVTMNVVKRIAVTTQPTKTTYTEGETFDPSGMVITATYADGSTKQITDYSYTPTTALTTANTTVVITYTGSESTSTLRTTVAIVVEEKSGSGDIDSDTTTYDSITVYTSFINSGKIVVNHAPVTVYDKDKDGKYTISDAFKAMHETYYGSEAGYSEMSNATLTGWVTKFWGQGTSGFCYVVNNSWTSSTQNYINSGASIAAFFCEDLVEYSDLYTWFSSDSYTAVVGTAKTLTVNGMNVMGSSSSGDLRAAPKGATVTVYQNGTKVTALSTTVDENGQFVLTFTEAGTYTIEVSGTASYGNYRNAPVVPSRCTVTVTGDSSESTDSTDETNQVQAEAVEKLIDKIGTVTKESGDVIKAAREAYEKLTAEQKVLVSNYDKLVAAEKQYTKLTGERLFIDVEESDYFYDAVKWAVEEEITNGTSTYQFSPNDSCTRAQMVTFLWRAAGEPEAKTTTCVFTDVDRDAYYYEALLWAVENGITNGTSSTTFSPDQACTRGQMVTFLYRYAKEPNVTGNHPFTDVKDDAYYKNAVIWAVAEGVTKGTSASTFSPDATCTRGQMVTFLYRYLAE